MIQPGDLAPKLAAKDNAAPTYLSAFTKIPQESKFQPEAVKFELDVFPASLWPSLKAFLAKYDEVFSKLAVATKMPGYDFKTDYTQGVRAQRPEIAALRESNVLLNLHAREQAHDGDFGGAAESLGEIAGMADQTARQPGILSMMMAQQIRTAAMTGLARILNDENGSAQAVELARTALKKLDGEPDLVYALKTDAGLWYQALSMPLTYSEKDPLQLGQKGIDADTVRDAYRARLLNHIRQELIVAGNQSVPLISRGQQLEGMSEAEKSMDATYNWNHIAVAGRMGIISVLVRASGQAAALTAGLSVLDELNKSGSTPKSLPPNVSGDPANPAGGELAYQQTGKTFSIQSVAIQLPARKEASPDPSFSYHWKG